MQPNSTKKTILVSLILCLVCSFLVSISAVGLKNRQQSNQELERKKNILVAAGLFDPKQDSLKKVPQLFDRIDSVLINLGNGKPVDKDTFNRLGGDQFDQIKSLKNGKLSTVLTPESDISGIKQRENYAWVYQVKSQTGADIEQYVFPVRGKGLWSTLWGFVSLDADLKTINGLAFYKHGETPGLGGEIDSDQFKNAWHGKLAFDQTWQIKIELPKQISSDEELAQHQVEAIPGATITSRGVQNTLHFWFGDFGFGKYLARQRSEQNLTQEVPVYSAKGKSHG